MWCEYMATLEEIRRILAQKASASDGMALRKLTDKETSRKKRLERLLKKIEDGKDVSRRELQTALTEAEWEAYEQMAEQESSLKDLENRPKDFDRYIDILKLADFYHNRAQSTPTTSRSRRDHDGRAGAARLAVKAESIYESALEHLEELIMGADRLERGDLLTWLDRPVEFTAGADIGADPISVPRVLGSRSIHARSSLTQHNVFEIRRGNKRQALQEALNSLIYEEVLTTEDEGQGIKRKELLRFSKSEDDF